MDFTPSMLVKSTIEGSTQKADVGGSQTLGQSGKQRSEEQEESRGAPQVVVGDRVAWLP